MSDRRPPELFVEYKSRDAGNIERKRYHHASSAHLIAAVRSGVESGTIKGEVLMWCVTHRCAYDDGAPACSVWMAVIQGGGRPKPCVINQFSEVLVIPVSDGGSET